MKVQRIVVHETGAPAVMQLVTDELPAPGPTEVQVAHQAVGINLADTYFRSGLYPGKTPFGLGVEGSGIITAVGHDVSRFSVGDRVTYTSSPLGAYCTARNMPIDSLIPLPDAISCDTAAASTMRGLTASYLLQKIWDLHEGDTVVMQAAAGGVGMLFCQMASAMGLKVIGVVGRDEKKAIAQNAGCIAVLNSRTNDVVSEVKRLTNGRGATMVVDGVGKDTFDVSLSCVRRRGLMVCLGTASGPVAPFDPPLLMRKGSIYVTRPAMADYIADPIEKQELVDFYFSHLLSGTVQVLINQRWSLDQAVEAHESLEAGNTTGSSIFEMSMSDKGEL